MGVYIAMGSLVVVALIMATISAVADRRDKSLVGAILEEGSWILTGGAFMVYASTFQSIWVGIVVFIVGTLIMLTRPRKVREMLEEE